MTIVATPSTDTADLRACRGSADVATSTPLLSLMPAVFQEDDFTGRFTAGLDDVLAPVIGVLDSLDAYVDPWLAPTDFLQWLAGWVGLILNEDWPVERQRALVARSIELYRMRGTVAGLRAEIETFSGGDVQVADSGGCACSQTPGGTLPGEAGPRVAIRVAVDDPASVNVKALDALVAAAKPAHVIHRVEVVQR